MIELQGTLTVRAINGRNGVFRIGELDTSVGEFKVKDKILEQFEAGTYTGRFLVDRIFPECYTWYGKVVTEIRAKLADVEIDQDEPERATEDPVTPAEPDPAEFAGDEQAEARSPNPAKPASTSRRTRGDRQTNRAAATPLVTPELAAPPPPATDPVDGEDPVDDLVRVFGSEIARAICAGDPVKLDPTVDRAPFREQRTALKEQYRYTFKATEQTWYLA